MAMSICNYCVNCVGKCSWSKSLVPVEGWTAEKTVYKMHDGKKGVSYRVYECPQFEKVEERKPERRGKYKSRSLLEACRKD